MTDFAEKLKAARKAAGMTQHEMADRTLIPFRTVQQWEGGQRTPPPYVQRLVLNELEKLKQREAYHITPEDLARERHNINTYAPLKALEKIAGAYIPELRVRVLMHGLDTRGSDEGDFFETAVWSVKEALVAAYLLGKKDAERD